MKKFIYGFAIGILALFAGSAVADYTIKDGAAASQTVFAFVCFTTKICPGHVPINSAGTEIGTSGAPIQVTVANTGANATAVKVNAASGGIAAGALAAGAGVDGWDLTQGAIADAAVTAGATGSVSAKLRAISRDIGTLATLFNANGRATSANSSPMVPPAAPTTWHLIAANSTNATSVKGSAATLFSCQLGNIDSTAVYLKIYNKATAPTVGSDTPVKTLIIPKAGTAADGAGNTIFFGPGGLALGTGFAAAVTAGITVADTTAVAASKVAINCDYE